MGTITLLRCSVENQKGAIIIYTLYSDSILLVLNRTPLNIDSAILALNYDISQTLERFLLLVLALVNVFQNKFFFLPNSRMNVLLPHVEGNGYLDMNYYTTNEWDPMKW